MNPGKLDMRMDRTQEFSAYDVVNTYSSSELNRIIKDYGEERWAKRVVEFILDARSENQLKQQKNWLRL